MTQNCQPQQEVEGPLVISLTKPLHYYSSLELDNHKVLSSPLQVNALPLSRGSPSSHGPDSLHVQPRWSWRWRLVGLPPLPRSSCTSRQAWWFSRTRRTPGILGHSIVVKRRVPGGARLATWLPVPDDRGLALWPWCQACVGTGSALPANS